jgi:subtilisin family serine protease
LDYPAADPSVLAVGASALNDNGTPRDYATSTEYVASYSNYVLSPAPNEYYVVAPGGDPSVAQQECSTEACLDFLQWILNLYSNTAHIGHDEISLYAGTSQATPHVAGLAALMLTKDGTLTPAQIGSIISTSAHNIGDVKQGHGRIDALAALNATP